MPHRGSLSLSGTAIVVPLRSRYPFIATNSGGGQATAFSRMFNYFENGPHENN
jgi:hypothetical protein